MSTRKLRRRAVDVAALEREPEYGSEQHAVALLRQSMAAAAAVETAASAQMDVDVNDDDCCYAEPLPFYAPGTDAQCAYAVGRHAVLYYRDTDEAQRAVRRLISQGAHRACLAKDDATVVVARGVWPESHDPALNSVHRAASDGWSFTAANALALCTHACQTLRDDDDGVAPPLPEALLHGAWCTPSAAADHRWAACGILNMAAWTRAVRCYNTPAALARHLCGFDVGAMPPHAQLVPRLRCHDRVQATTTTAPPSPPSALAALTGTAVLCEYMRWAALAADSCAFIAGAPWPATIGGLAAHVYARPYGGADEFDDTDQPSALMPHARAVAAPSWFGGGEQLVTLYVTRRPRYTATAQCTSWPALMCAGAAIVRAALAAPLTARIDPHVHAPYALVDEALVARRNALGERHASDGTSAMPVAVAMLAEFLLDAARWQATLRTGPLQKTYGRAAYELDIGEWARWSAAVAWQRHVALPDALVRPVILASIGVATPAASCWAEYEPLLGTDDAALHYAPMLAQLDYTPMVCGSGGSGGCSAPVSTKSERPFDRLPDVTNVRTRFVVPAGAAVAWAAGTAETVRRVEMAHYARLGTPLFLNGSGGSLETHDDANARLFAELDDYDGELPMPLSVRVTNVRAADGSAELMPYSSNIAAFTAVMQSTEAWLANESQQHGVEREAIAAVYCAERWTVRFGNESKAHGVGLETELLVRALDYAFAPDGGLFGETPCGRYCVPTVSVEQLDEDNEARRQLMCVGYLLAKNVYAWHNDGRTRQLEDGRFAARGAALLGARPYRVPLPPAQLAAVFACAAQQALSADDAHAELVPQRDKTVESWCASIIADAAAERCPQMAAQLAAMLAGGNFELVTGEPTPEGTAHAALRTYWSDVVASECAALSWVAAGIASVLPMRGAWATLLHVLPAAARADMLGCAPHVAPAVWNTPQRVAAALDVHRSAETEATTLALLRRYLHDDEDTGTDRRTRFVRCVTGRAHAAPQSIYVEVIATKKAKAIVATCSGLLRLPPYTPVVADLGMETAYALFVLQMDALLFGKVGYNVA
jgi:hypothetical protein